MIVSRRFICPVCARPEEGVGVNLKGYWAKDADAWCCVKHLKQTRRILQMKHTEYEQKQAVAYEAADEAAGAYMVSINKFDFRDFTVGEMSQFWRAGVAAYLDKMDELVSEETPF